MFKQFISTFTIFNMLFVTTSSSFADTNTDFKNFKESEKFKIMSSEGCNYHLGVHNQLENGKCKTRNADAIIPGIATIATKYDFQSSVKELSEYDDVKGFYKGDKEACLSCSGTSDKDLKDIEQKILKEVNIQRQEYGAQIFKEAVISNVVSFSDRLKATEKVIKLVFDENKLYCEKEFEEINNDDDCREKFLNPLDDRFKVGRGFGFLSKNKKDNFKNFKNSLKHSDMLIIKGSKAKKTSNLFNKVQDIHPESAKQEEYNRKKVDPGRYVKYPKDNNWEPKSDKNDNIISQFSINLKDIEDSYHRVEDSFAKTLSSVSDEEYERYCLRKNTEILSSMLKDVEVLSSYSKFRGQISKISICELLKSNYKKKKKTFSTLDLKSHFGKSSRDLKKEYKNNCKKALAKVKKYACSPKTSIDDSAFYNENSEYGKHPFFDLYSRASYKEKLTYKAFACIYGPLVATAAKKESHNDYSNNSRNRNLNSISSSNDQGGLVDFKLNGVDTSNPVPTAEKDLGSDTIEEVSNKLDDVATGEVFKQNGVNNYVSNNLSSPTNAFNNAYSKDKDLKNNFINKANTNFKSKKIDENEAKNKTDKLSRLDRLTKENTKLTSQIAKLKADATLKEQEAQLDQLNNIKSEIAKLKKEKNQIEKEKEINQASSSRSSRAIASSSPSKVSASVVPKKNEVIYTPEEVNAAAKKVVTASNLSEKKQALSTPKARRELDNSYNTNLTAILSKNFDGEKLDGEVSRIVTDMISNGAISHIQIVEKEGVKVVVFEDQSKEIALNKFTKKTQSLLKEYISYLQGNKIQEKREEIIDLNLKEQVAVKYASFIEEFENELKFQE